VDSDAIRGIAWTYFDAWRSRDFDRLRSILAHDVSFRGPLGTTDGVDATIAGLRAMAET
jgi:ketosteroid isomerase-like protein